MAPQRRAVGGIGGTRFGKSRRIRTSGDKHTGKRGQIVVENGAKPPGKRGAGADRASIHPAASFIRQPTFPTILHMFKSPNEKLAVLVSRLTC